MPPIQYYTVTQEREVNVQANGPVDAARVAEAVFNGEEAPEGVALGNATGPIRTRSINVREDY